MSEIGVGARRTSRKSLALPWMLFGASLLTTMLTIGFFVLFSAVDSALISVADDAGWDTQLLLPKQHLIWFLSGAAAVMSATTSVAALTLLLIERSRLAASTQVP